LTEALNEAKQIYETIHPNVELALNLGSSGQCAKAIMSGAPADLFISADHKTMDVLEKAGWVDAADRVPLLCNRLVLIATEKMRDKIKAPEDLRSAEVKKISVGDPAHVPAGRYAEEALRRMNLWDALSAEGKLAKEIHVKAVLERTAQGYAEAGIVYATDAARKTAGVVSVFTFPSDSHSPIVYPAAVLKRASPRAEASAFLAWLRSAEGTALWKRFGFSPAAAHAN
jgi:molybdate transport system substrate-binding protein